MLVLPGAQMLLFGAKVVGQMLYKKISDLKFFNILTRHIDGEQLRQIPISKEFNKQRDEE